MPKPRSNPAGPEESTSASEAADTRDVVEPPRNGGNFPIVGVGASAGGLDRADFQQGPPCSNPRESKRVTIARHGRPGQAGRLVAE